MTEETIGSEKRERLSLKTKIGYGMGDIYGGGAFVIIGAYYLYFLTDVLRINPALAGTVIMISKIWDAITDPLMGILSDRTRTRFGRRRVYFLIGIPLIFISFLLLWYPASFETEAQRFIYALVSYMFFATVITMVMVPYNALAPELTLDYNERINLTSFRMFFSMFSSVLCAVLPLEIVKRFPSVKTGYVTMATFFGLLFAMPFIFTFLTTCERPEFWSSTSKLNFKEDFLEPFKNRSFLMVLFMYLFGFFTMDIVMAILIYFMTYYLGKGGLTNYALGVLLLTEILFIPLWAYIGRRFGKRTAFITSALIWMSAMALSFAIGPKSSTAAILVFSAIVGIGVGGVIVMIYSIFADIPDVDELKTGKRREGTYSGLFTFVRKLSSAAGLFLISNIIALAGYIPPKEEIVDGTVKMVEQAQTPQFILTLRIVFAVLPIGILTLCLIAAVKYPLTRKIHEKLKRLLELKRQKVVLEDEWTEEEEKLKKLLIGR